METKLSQVPFFRLILPFTAGIALALHYPNNFFFVYAALVLFLLILGWKFYDKYLSDFKYRWVFGTLLTGLLFSCGYSFTLLNTPTERHSDISNHLQGEKTFLISVASV